MVKRSDALVRAAQTARADSGAPAAAAVIHQVPGGGRTCEWVSLGASAAELELIAEALLTKAAELAAEGAADCIWCRDREQRVRVALAALETSETPVRPTGLH